MTTVEDNRAAEICGLFGSRVGDVRTLKITNWIGVVRSLSMNLNGDGGILQMDIGNGATVSNSNNDAFPKTSDLFRLASTLRPGDLVQFSGAMNRDDRFCLDQHGLSGAERMDQTQFFVAITSMTVSGQTASAEQRVVDVSLELPSPQPVPPLTQPAMPSSDPYSNLTSRVPRNYPAVAAKWVAQLPPSLRGIDWIANFKGVTPPLREIQVDGSPMLLGSVCQPGNCGNQIAILFAPDAARVVGRVESDQSLWIGNPTPREQACIQSSGGTGNC